jgi:hypothetical protein
VRFNICSNTDNGVGLEQDCRVLKGLLESWGHQVRLVHFKKQNELEEAQTANVTIHVEVIGFGILNRAVENWFIPNPEWFASWDFPEGMGFISKFLCKTHTATDIFRERFGPRAQYIGFEARDLYDEDVPRVRKFLHVAGQSRYKNSAAVAYAFAKFFDDRDLDIRKELTFVGAYPDEVAFARDHKNVVYIQRASEAELRHLMNSHLFHLMPSSTEGYGQALNEGLGCGAVMLTTNYGPMNEFVTDPDLLIPYQRLVPELAAQRAMVGAMEVKAAVEKVWKLPEAQLAQIQTGARTGFLERREAFRQAFKRIVDLT